jgi:DUF3102 family protein
VAIPRQAETMALEMAAHGLPQLAEKIRTVHLLAVEAMSAALTHARDAGTLLIEAKGRCKHGDWLPWLKDAVGIPPRTAQAYMRVAERWPELQAQMRNGCANPPLQVREALKMLAAPSPEPKLPWEDEADPRESARKFLVWADRKRPDKDKAAKPDEGQKRQSRS